MIKNPFEKLFQQKEVKLEENEHFPKETFKSFESGEIDLPIYDIKIELPKNCFFRNDKTVESLLDHTKSVLKEFSLNPEEFLNEDELKSLIIATGSNRFLKIKDKKGNVLGKFTILFILPKKEKERGLEFQIFNEAHEIAHAMYDLDEKTFNIFAEKIFQKVDIQINLKGLDEETVCTIMGLLAIKLHNIPMDAFNKHGDFRNAYNILQELIKKYPESYST